MTSSVSKVLATCCACVFLISSSRADPNAIQLAAVNSVLENYIRPGFQIFSETAGRVPAALEIACDSPGEKHLETAREAFRASLESFAYVELVRLGPLTQENRTERLLFWPDRRSLGLRQVQRALAEQDPTVAAADTLAQKSVALQGFGALEFLLFGTGADTLLTNEGSFRCKFALAVAQNIDNLSNAIASDWASDDGYTRIWLNPSADNAAYRTPKESLGDVFATLAQGLELIRDQRVAPIVQSGEKPVNPKRAIFWRSNMTLPVVAANFHGAQAMLDATGLSDILPESDGRLVRSADFEFANTERTIHALKGPIQQVVANPDDQGRLTYLLIVTSSLREIVQTQIAPALGLPSSFSVTDGD